MRDCVVVPLLVNGAGEYVWRWRAAKAGLESPTCFHLFYDCVEDARRRGLVVDFEASVEASRHPDRLGPDIAAPGPAAPAPGKSQASATAPGRALRIS